MDSQNIFDPVDSGEVISPAQESLKALKKAMGKYGMPTGICIDTGKEFIRVFGDGDSGVKVRTRQALQKQLDALTERAEHPEFNDDLAGIANAAVAVADELNKLDTISQVEKLLKKLDDMGLDV